MNTTSISPWPGGFDDFRRSRNRFFDRLAADDLLRQVEREANDVTHVHQPEEPTAMKLIVVEGELSILTQERRLVVDFYTSDQHDLADVVRERADAAEAFGIAHVGPARISVELLAQEPDPPSGGAEPEARR
jgi:hypothetical protein